MSRYTRGVKRRLAVTLGVALSTASPSVASAQQPREPAVEPPAATAATAAPEVPRVRIGDTMAASRRVFDQQDTGLRPAPAYTYLASKPGAYIRTTPITGRIAYIQNLNAGWTYVTFTGGLRVAIGK